MSSISKRLIRLGKKSVRARVEHEALMQQGPIALQASQLRMKGLELEGQGWMKSASECFEAAYGLFDEADQSPAAAAAAHTLGAHLAATPEGIAIQNLLRAERLIKRALDCPERERDLYRAAMSRDSLAKVYRRLAELPNYIGERERECLDSSLQMRREAVRLCEERGVEGWLELPRWLYHLGNTLADLGDSEAKAAQGRAERATKATLALIKGGGRGRASEKMAFKLLPLRGQADVVELESLLSLIYGARAKLFLEEGPSQDIARARRYARLGLAHGDVRSRDAARIAMAHVEVAAGEDGDRTEALSELARVRKDTLHQGNRIPLARAHLNLGDEEGALALLMEWTEEAIGIRKQALADHVADHAAAEAQRLAAIAARIHTKVGRSIEAFCALETVSALRFYDELDQHIWGAKDALTWQLDRRRKLVGLHASKAEEMLAFLSASEPAHQRKLLRLQARVFDEDGGEPPKAESPDECGEPINVGGEEGGATEGLKGWSEMGDERPEWHIVMDKRFALRLRSIAESQVPQQQLKLFSDELRKDALDLWEKVKARDPSFGQRVDLFDVTPAHLALALAERPGRVLLRLDLGVNLLLCAVWMEEGALKAWSDEVAFDLGVISQLQSLGSEEGSTHPELYDQTSRALAAVDFGPLLSKCPRGHLVLLPSLFAYLLPLAALGRPGQTFLDHFGEISWLPNLSPLFNRFSPHPRREGQVTFTPGGTHFHALAFKDLLPHEMHIDGAITDARAFRDSLTQADVMSIYTHGAHFGDRGPAVSLGQGGLILIEDVLLALPFKGMERVELWCCESGVNLSTSPLTPHVDEMFGFDRFLLKEGVRSTIASLWAVPDFVTACLVHRYRQGVATGVSAPAALAGAQRWWRDEGVTKLDQLLEDYEHLEAIERFGEWLGYPLGGQSMAVELGRERSDHEAIIKKFRHPISWAGFRFTGVSERRPECLEEVVDRPLTPAEEVVLADLLGEPVKRLSIDERQEPEMKRIRDEVSDMGLTTPRALRMARLYRERLASRHQHNVLAGLAWLYECLSNPAVNDDDRLLLRVEAAHLWLDLVEAERVIPLEAWGGPVFPGTLERAEGLLHQAPPVPDVSAARARCQRLRIEALGVDPNEIDQWRETVWLPQMNKIWRDLKPAIGDPAGETYSRLRVWMVALDHLALAGEELGDEGRNLLEQLETTSFLAGRAVELQCAYTRLMALEGALRLIVAPKSHMWEPDPKQLPPWEGGRLCFQELQAFKSSKRGVQRAQTRRYGHLQNREIMLFSYPGDGSEDFFQATGTAGAAYRRLSGNILHSNAILGSHDSALNLVAASQFHADLRLEWLNKVGGGLASATFKNSPNPFRMLWAMMEAREHIFQALADSACGFPSQVEGASKRYMRLDPIAHPISEILEKVDGEPDQLAMGLAIATMASDMNDVHGYTCAFSAVRSAEKLSEALLQTWKSIREIGTSNAREILEAGAAEQLAELEPQNRIAALEANLQHMDPDRVLVALIPAQGGFVTAAAIWRAEGQLHQRLIGSTLPIGRYLDTLFVSLVAPTQPGIKPNPSHARRGEAWAQLAQFIEPLISSALGDVPKAEGRGLLIFAPGPFRALPWGGLNLGGQLVRDRFSNIRHLPTLSFEPSPPQPAPDGPYTVCLLAGEPTEDTPFGHCTIMTLRDWFPHVAAEQSPADGTTDVPEGPIFGEAAQGAVNLRLYGESYGWPAGPATSALGLSGRRVFSHINLIRHLLPFCNSAEIWGDTGGLGQLVSMKGGHEDRIPGLAYSLLANGARGVLDLAWPIHDLVKALVCERYYIARWQEALPGAISLGVSLAWTADVLMQWTQAMPPDASLWEGLGWLDEARRKTAQSFGLDDEALLPYANVSSTLDDSLRELIQDVNQPHHMAAFRWWGM